MNIPSTSADTPPVAGISIALPIDARPILPRSGANLWERTEQVRRELIRLVEQKCRDIGIEALVLQSDPYVHPAFVQFECWIPQSERALTARSSMTVTLTVAPYHRFEAIYQVTWEKHGRRGTIDHVHTFGEHEVAALVEFLCAEPDGLTEGVLYNRVKTILAPLQVRHGWWQLWQPHNRVKPLRRDWLPIASVAAIVAGFWFLPLGSLYVGLGDASRAESDVSSVGLTDPYIGADILGLLPERTPGTQPIYAGRTMSSSLDPSDPRLDFGGYYERWSYLAEAGERLVVSLRSDAFDSFLLLGQMQQDEFVTLEQDDDSGGERNARIEFVAPTTAEYLVLASSYDGGSTGPYTLRVDRSDDLAVATPASPPPAQGVGGFILGGFARMFLILGGVLGLVAHRRAPRLVRSAGKPMAEPRILHYLDSWQTVVFGAGGDADEIQHRLMALVTGAHQQRFGCAVERIWHWGLDGKIEREQIVLRYGRALVFCQIYSYGSDLYVGWDAHMNLGTWMEKKLAAGIDRETGQRVRLMTVEHAVQPTGKYDLIDLNCLAEWTHAQVSQMLKHYLKEREIDQEIDFTIIRGERQRLTPAEEGKKQRRDRFRRSA